MRRLPAALAVLATVAVLAAPSDAAPLSFTDPRGDVVAPLDEPGLDLLSVTFATSGVVSRGRYVPISLLVTLGVAGDVVQRPGVTYEVKAAATSCNQLTFTYSSGTVYGQQISEGRLRVSCMPDMTLPAEVRIEPGKLTFRVGLRDLPEQFGQGIVVLSDFRVTTEVRDPAFAQISTNDFTEFANVQTAIDVATSTRRWRLA